MGMMKSIVSVLDDVGEEVSDDVTVLICVDSEELSVFSVVVDDVTTGTC
jgi:hypothetical protein